MSKQLLAWRKLARRLHLWLGLSLGMFFVILCLSGAALVYYPQIDTWLHPELVNAAQQPCDYNTALKTLRMQYPDKLGPWRFEVTPEQQFIPARYYNPQETQGQDFAPMMVWLSADGSTLLRKSFWGDYLVTWLYNLHFTLLLGSTGTIIVGYFGIGSALLLLAGLVAWWPKSGFWLRQLRFKRRAALLGRMYDWHKTIGLVMLLPLFILTSTGAMLALPKETNGLLGWALGKVESAARPAPQLTFSNPQISVTQAVKIAQTQLPKARLAWIETPSVNQGYYRLRMQVSDDKSTRFPNSYIDINPRSGEVVKVFDLRQQGTSNQIKNWLHPLHNGSVGGLSLKVLWIIASLASLVLAWLGWYRYYLRKNTAKKIAKNNKP
ncbi:PepSY domain-containing protein [Pseudoalteromonas sp. SG43-7]|uniref:PepSY-associated TM helix domain-containing protein n=1 Tax=Pseudoalteromonas sp. SG43-7 TaxID=2760966 RepID=UPI001600EDEC|nr:PepSY-associated TM helix domain-containing protein [Pseudoalteromonas sp. SG43-7]MBB1423206.1 PepSY domain-containing protein [Pseudoalteromonas sp. SG43-7]